MNALLGLASTLLDSDLDPEHRTSIVAIHDAADNLLRILNDILDFSKLEAGRMEFEEIPFSPAALIDAVLGIIRPRAAAKGLEIRTQSDPRLPPVLIGDVGRIRQVLLNLLSNAVTFTAAGEICLAVRRLAPAGDRVTVEWSVSDTGIGIATERLDALFSDFVQADCSISRRFGGSGLGLAICKRIVKQMGGDIGVESIPGRGSTFHFGLSLAWADALKLEERTDATAVADLKAAIAALGRPLRILVAEDNPTNQLVAVKMLKEFDIQVSLVGDGAAAVEAVAQSHFDAVFMDLRMPEMDGLEATRTIRARGGALAALPIIAVTANAYPEDVRLCRKAGMSDFIAKPVRKQMLAESILRALRRRPQSAPLREFAEYPRRPIEGRRDEQLPPTDAPPDAEEIVDRTAFERLAAEIGDDGASETLRVFIEETNMRLRKLRTLSCREERETIANEAHTLKGAAGTLGLRQLAALARGLEHRAGAMSAAEYDATLDRLESAFARARLRLPVNEAA